MRQGMAAFVRSLALGAPAAPQTVDEIIAKHVEALGGMAKLKTCR